MRVAACSSATTAKRYSSHVQIGRCPKDARACRVRRQLSGGTGRRESIIIDGGARDAELLGGANGVALAREVYQRSLVGTAQPGSWLEVSLLGEPGFDMNVYYRREQLAMGDRFSCGDAYGHQSLVDWLVGVDGRSFGIGLAYDLAGGEVGRGAYINPNNVSASARDGFFRAIGEAEAGVRSACVVSRQPNEWVVMEEGVFADRPGRPARIASHVGRRLQRAYAADAGLRAAHLRQVGFEALDDEMLACLCEMASSPFDLWLEFDVLADGSVGDALGADLLFGGSVIGEAQHASFAEEGAATKAMQALERRGLADGRWRALAGASTRRLVPHLDDAGEVRAFVVRSEPVFVKAKWVAGRDPLAKVYQSCDVVSHT